MNNPTQNQKARMVAPLTKSSLKSKGFTLIELLVVIGVIGVLSMIAISFYAAARTQSFNASAKSDLKSAYTASQAFFGAFPTGQANLAALKGYGYNQNPNVSITVTDGHFSTLSIAASYMESGTTSYSVDSTGIISP
jgi:prepilin-type N-terminal cleavage/methylation domain-containing protein